MYKNSEWTFELCSQILREQNCVDEDQEERWRYLMCGRGVHRTSLSRFGEIIQVVVDNKFLINHIVLTLAGRHCHHPSHFPPLIFKILKIYAPHDGVASMLSMFKFLIKILHTEIHQQVSHTNVCMWDIESRVFMLERNLRWNAEIIMIPKFSNSLKWAHEPASSPTNDAKCSSWLWLFWC